MATILETINQVLTYENEPERRRELLKNTFELTEEQVTALMQAIESIPEDYTELVSVVEGLVASYGALENTVEDLTGDVGDITDSLENKADQDGTYENLTAGNALQLLATDYTEDKVPYLFRTSGGSADIGNREEDVIVGGSVAWNQLMPNPENWVVQSGNPELIVDETGGTLTATSEINAYNPAIQGSRIKNSVNGHKYFLHVEFRTPDNTSDTIPSLYISSSATSTMAKAGTSATGWASIDYIFNATKSGEAVISYLGLSNASAVLTEGDHLEFKNVRVVDLTQMFGSAIADLAYSKEQTTAGSGVAWLKSMGFFVKDYYPYDAGTLKSVEGLVSHDMVGFNQWDEQWELGYYDAGNGNKINVTNEIRSKNLVPVLPNTAYYGRGFVAVASCVYFDADENYIGWSRPIGVFTTPNNAYYMALNMGNNYGTTYKNDICINLSWSGYRNGEYQPYVKHSYPLDSSLTLRGIPKADASGNLYYDGDRYLPDGTVERRYDVVDLGTLNWTADSNRSGVFYSYSLISVIKNVSPWADLICSRYVLNKTNPNSLSDKQISSTNNYGEGRIFIKDSAFEGYTGEQVASALSNVMLIYELATPTTETAQPYTTPQIVDDFGTEEYVIDSDVTVPVPVGHVTKYLANLRDKLQHLPDLADSDGYYLIQQTGTDLTLIAFRIPRAPEIDGTYTLKCTVSGGSPVYEWESVT